MGVNRSVSKKFAAPCRATASRSTLAPVSMFFAGSSARTSACASTSSCMKTWFQISMNRSSSTAGPPSGPNAGPRSTKISLQGPAGPAACVHQKLSALPRRTSRSDGMPRSCQMPIDSSSVS